MDDHQRNFVQFQLTQTNISTENHRNSAQTFENRFSKVLENSQDGKLVIKSPFGLQPETPTKIFFARSPLKLAAMLTTFLIRGPS